jgi:hypothetical protein
MNISLIATLLKRLAAVCFALVVFWHVAHQDPPQRGKAIVHVSQSDVMVLVDQKEHHVPTDGVSPVVCQLEPGNHWAQVWRRGVLLGQVRFTVEAGKDVMIPPFDRPEVEAEADTSVASDPPAPTARSIGTAGLAARIRPPAPTAVSY